MNIRTTRKSLLFNKEVIDVFGTIFKIQELAQLKWTYGHMLKINSSYFSFFLNNIIQICKPFPLNLILLLLSNKILLQK